MGSKVNWAAMDKRIRGRRPSWTREDLQALDTKLSRLPDVAAKAEASEVAQPALTGSEGDAESAESVDAAAVQDE